MQTQPNELEQSAQTAQIGEYLARFARYEDALNKIYHHTVEARRELSAARQSLADLTRVAKAAFDAKFVPAEDDRLFCRVLKDWATALMRNRGWVRSAARAAVLEHITAIKNVEESKAFLLTNSPNDFIIDGAASGRIQSREPNFTEQDKIMLDHLPEGSH